MSYIFRGLLCKTFPLGCITFGKIKNVCLSAGQASTYGDSLLRVLLGLAANAERIYSRNQGQEKKVVRAADRPHYFQCNHNLQKRKEGGEKKGVVVNKGEKSWTAQDN